MYTWGYIKEACLSKLDLSEKEAIEQNLLNRFPFYANEAMTQICSAVKPKATFAEFDITKDDILISKSMPNDFVSFGDDVCTRKYRDEYGNTWLTECHDDDFEYKGYKHVIFFKPGKYVISYNARWCTFNSAMDNDYELDVPADILDCIPSYIVSQCYKIDDEYKAQVFRNEYEIMLARLDNTNYKNTKTIKIGGDW